MNYNFKIQNETIQQETEPVLYSGNVNIYSFTLDFDASWADFTKFAVFVKDGKTYTLSLTEDTLVLPGEILAGEGVIRFGLYGTNGTDDLQRISSNMISIPVLRGAYTEGIAPAVPAPDIWEQYLAKVQETAKESAEVVFTDMDERLTALEESGGSGGAGITVDSGLSAESENPVQNKVITGELTSLKNGINQTNANVATHSMLLYGFESSQGSVKAYIDAAGTSAAQTKMMLDGFQALSGSVKTYIDQSIKTAIDDSWEVAV